MNFSSVSEQFCIWTISKIFSLFRYFVSLFITYLLWLFTCLSISWNACSHLFDQLFWTVVFNESHKWVKMKSSLAYNKCVHWYMKMLIIFKWGCVSLSISSPLITSGQDKWLFLVLLKSTQMHLVTKAKKASAGSASNP